MTNHKFFDAEVAKLATHYMQTKFTDLPGDIKICNFVHDSWIIECDNNEAVYTKVAEITVKAMQEAWFECTRSTKIKDLPMPVDIYIGYK